MALSQTIHDYNNRMISLTEHYFLLNEASLRKLAKTVLYSPIDKIDNISHKAVLTVITIGVLSVLIG
jgi:hypothetical protein